MRYCVLLSSMLFFYFFFFKQKTAYEMRISDWSSDVCSSDLGANAPLRPGEHRLDAIEIGEEVRARAEESAARVLEVLRRGEQFVFVGLARLEIGEGRGEFR